MSIDRDVVRRIAALARLEVEDERADRLAAEMSDILAYVERLQQLDLSGCEPMALAPADAPLREDEPNGRRLSNDAALREAPAAEDGFFLVPPIVENLEP
jgi:aspartyl-tRNA(Asn)/glutamyl-tRNA(Gln) amidotransferase subunit C